MAHYDWYRPGWSEALLAADVADGVTAKLYVTYQDGVRATLTVSGEGVRGVMGDHASTDRSQDWPEVERFIPREEWPEEIYAGVRGPAERTPDDAVAKAIAEAWADWESGE